jgi:hypothetical protein
MIKNTAISILILSTLTILISCAGSSALTSPSLTAEEHQKTEVVKPVPAQSSTSPAPSTIIMTTSASIPTLVTPPATPVNTTSPVPVTTPLFTSSPAVTTTPATTLAPTPTMTTPPATISLYQGDWVSNEKNTGLIKDPYLKFTVMNNRVVFLNVSVFPIPSEWFMWFVDDPMEIKGNGFGCATFSNPITSGKGIFILEADFTSENKCEGTIRFTKGFFWVDFMLDHDVTITWTAQKK